MKRVDVLVVSNDDQYKMGLSIRRKVFIEEQGVPPSIEVDQYESESKHFLALIDGAPVGAGRMRIKKSYVKFERIASLGEHRGQGIGRALMAFMQDYAAKEFLGYLPAMHAQQSAAGFYEKLGWIAVGEEFFEANIAHRVLIFPPKDRQLLTNLKALVDSEVRDDIREYLRLQIEA